MIKIDSSFMLKALSKAHDPEKMCFFEELKIGTGFTEDSLQRFDAWSIHFYPSHRNVTICYELKCSKGDFKKEINNPLKRRAGLRLANKFFFVTPPGLCKIEEIPPECGLMEIDENGVISTLIEAPFRDVEPPTWMFVAALSRRTDMARKESYRLEELFKQKTLETNLATKMALDKHIRKWAEWSIGSKEIPDHIVRALGDLKAEVNDILKINEQTKLDF